MGSSLRTTHPDAKVGRGPTGVASGYRRRLPGRLGSPLMRPYTQRRSRRAHPKPPRRRRRRRLVLRSKRRPVAQPAYLASTRSDFPADGADEEPASRTKCKCPPHFTERFLLSSPTASSVVRSDRFSAFVRRNPRSRSSGTSVPGDTAVPPAYATRYRNFPELLSEAHERIAR